MQSLSVPVLREVFRHFLAFQALYEAHGVDEIVGPHGISFTLWDVEYLVEQVGLLPPRQAQAIQLCLIANVKEVDAAILMGVSPTNPVCAYASAGLSKMIGWIEEGRLPRFGLQEAS
jgi:hypothetical protein